jgi:4-diphosphocytidyl-2-C-methyl-D-erythritol kinase
LELLAPAKINLFLHVIGRRPDGYHELRSLMCCIDLYDRMLLQFGTSHNDIVCGHADVPEDETNLVIKAVVLFNKALRAETVLRPVNISVILSKGIPVGAGLGGGSSDAAAVLKGLNQYHGSPFGHVRLQALALELGADVPFFIQGRPALAAGIGEQLTLCDGLAAMDVVVVYPGFGFSTARIFKNLNLALTKSKKKLRYFPFNKGTFSATHHLHNDLEAGVGDQFPVIENIKVALLDQGALGSLMTGSGSAVFGLFADKVGALKAKAALDRHGDWQVFATRLLT